MNFFELSKINPKIQPYGHKLWTELARLTITVSIETVALRRGPNDGLEVWLTQRTKNEPAYPGVWHSPGSVMRVGEKIDDVIKRLEEREFGAKLISQTFAGNFNFPFEARGHFFSPVYACEVAPGGQGTWFAVDKLPEPMLAHHRDHVIPMAVAVFKK